MVFPIAAFDEFGVLSPTRDYTAVDISAGGIRLRSDTRFMPGDTALIQMTARTGGPGVVGLEVVHAEHDEQGRWRVGARFTSLTAEMVRAVLNAGDAAAGTRRATA